ncbi:hypothetical protein [Phenylobacterium sp.]|jgi:hypothetical protein|uniref:hypothetical protein n=1 Tax=Phenylobacterium sp. TaxID=1871053 RepID=UPI002E35CFB8|nr:hypothetical protein [Phenylobacterium sp.]HEX3367734.1 hypothetical protein [Phenylobacterium sp.]
MTPYDPSQDAHAGETFGPFMPPRARPRAFGGRYLLFAGVAGACVLGVSLGLWARPGVAERRAAAVTPAPAAPAADPAARKLRIVLDDGSAPAASPPGPVVTPVAATFATPAPQMAQPPVIAPAPPRVVRVQTPLPPTPAAAPPPVARPPALPKLTPLMVAALAEVRSVQTRLSRPIAPLVRLPATPPPAQLAKAEPPPAPASAPKAKLGTAPKPAHATQLARATADRAAAAKAAPDRVHAVKLAAAKAAAAHRIELAQAAQAEKAAQAQKAEILKAKFEKAKADKLEKARLFRVAQTEQVKLAQAEARGRAEAKAEARAEAVAEAREEARKQIRLASLARVVRQVLPHPAKPAAPVQTAHNDRKHKGRHEPVVERASVKAHKAPHAAAPPPWRRSEPVAPPPHASGLMKVSTSRCAARDPGEAVVCADPSLGAADRQLSRAYQGARAAGVPDAQLQRQQQRWLQARSAAAREAPWAVHDVYLARIAELNSQAHDARPDGY